MSDSALTEQQLRILRCHANGVDHISGQPVPYAMQKAAVDALHKLDREKMADAERAEAAAEAKRQADRAAEESKRQFDRAQEEIRRQAIAQEEIARRGQVNDFELQHRQLDIKEQEVAIQKADVAVRLLEVASRGGLDLRSTLLALSDMGIMPANRLLEATPPPSPPPPTVADLVEDE